MGGVIMAYLSPTEKQLGFYFFFSHTHRYIHQNAISAWLQCKSKKIKALNDKGNKIK